MSKISYKVAAAIAICTIIVSILIGGISVTKGSSIITNLASNQMVSIAKSTAENLDANNLMMEEKVNNIAISVSNLVDGEKLKNDPNYISEFSKTIDPLIKNYASTSKGVMGAYMSFDPKITGQVYEVWYADKKGDGKFEKQEFTDISEYDPNNKNMSWYYDAIKAGKGVWSSPYLDPDIKVYMISYTQPVYVNNVFIGVAGIDFRYDDYKKRVSSMKVFDTGYAFLLDKNFNLLVHPTFKDTDNLKKINNGSLEFLANTIEKEQTGIVNYKYKGAEQILAYAHLANGQIISIDAPKNEVLKDMLKLKTTLISISLIIVLISIFLALVLGKLISKPILKLSVLINKTADFDFIYDTSYTGMDKYKDEVGVMARAIMSLRGSLREMAGELLHSSQNITSKVDNVKELTNNLTLEAEDTSVISKELSIGMEKMAASIEEINTSAFEIEKSALDTSKRAEKGNDISIEVSNRANSLKEDAIKSKKNAESVYTNVKSELQGAIEKSKEVSKINNLAEAILQITEQTNLLALNASIEASRAGESGKGFAIVADEIRKLSEESSQTVENIKEVIESVNMSVNYLVINSEKILSFIEKEILLDYEKLIRTGEQYNLDAEFFNDFMTNFSETAQQLNLSINSVVSAIEEITSNVNQGAIGIDGIAVKSQDIAEKIEVINENIEENLLSAEKLNGIVSKMKI